MAGNDLSSGLLGKALIEFAANGLFPEEDVSSLKLQPGEIATAVKQLAEARPKLEKDIKSRYNDTATELKAALGHTQSLRDDMHRAKEKAGWILRQGEAPDVSGETIQQAEGKADFLVKELDYNFRVLQTLKAIKAVNATLDLVEQARDERRILDALSSLEACSRQLDSLATDGTFKALDLLRLRVSELRLSVLDALDHVWNSLVHIDAEEGLFSVQETIQGETMSLSDAISGLQASHLIEPRMTQLCRRLDRAIIAPRMNMRSTSIPAVQAQDRLLKLDGDSDRTVNSLFADLTQVFAFLVQMLPPELVQPPVAVLMPEVISRIVSMWLDSAVPSALANMDQFEDVIESARGFCKSLSDLNYSGFDELREWVDSAPKVWLSKCRETALDAVRTNLWQGLGAPKEVERVETRMVSRSEQKELATNGPSVGAATDVQDWDAAWPDEQNHEENSNAKRHGQPNIDHSGANEQDDDGADAWGAWSGDDEELDSKDADSKTEEDPMEGDADEGDADAWGWGDDDAQADAAPKPEVKPTPPKTLPKPRERRSSKTVPETRQVTLKEVYNISSMPEPVLALIFSILEDGAALTQTRHENSPVAAAAAGLFSVPTLVLAMFRAVTTYYYSMEIGGNMFLYNDALFLAEKLGDFASSWKTREDLTPRARNMLRIDNDIKSLQAFANRAYGLEISTQKTIISDLLGGEQSGIETSSIEAAVAQVRSVAKTWEDILPRSAWYQAIGSLVEFAATRMIAYVMDMQSIAQDDAFDIATMIAKLTELDDLFPPVGGGDVDEFGGAPVEPIPSTSRYAPSWLRLNYLSQVLQASLVDVRFLWMESELSLFFTVDEVVDLITASFADNKLSKDTIREIRHNPQPIAG